VDGDLSVGSFTADGPWLVDPATMEWREGIDARRALAAARVAGLTRRRLLPGWRSLGVLLACGARVLPWLLVERRRGGEAATRSLVARLRVAFERLGPTYLKFAQLVSSAEGLLPRAVVDEFKLSQDRVPAEPFAVVRATVEAELGASLIEVFDEFDEVPLAAASIAQVHAARLRTGEQVVVKVQRSTIRRVVPKDIRVMAWVARLLVGRLRNAALANPLAYVELFAESISEELDFRLEAQNMLDIARVLAATQQRRVICPRPHPSLVTERVLVMERLHGWRADDVETLRERDVDPAEVLRALFVCFIEGAVIHGVFHGDMHGGNTLVTNTGHTILLDYGITGRLTEIERIALLRLLMSAVTRDHRAQIVALRDLGAFPAEADPDAILATLDIESLLAKQAADVAAAEMADELRELVTQLLAHGARLPKALMLYVKGMIYLTGAISRIGADLDVVAEMTHLFTYMTQTHADEFTRSLGFDLAATPLDLAAVISDATGADVRDGTTLRELQQMQSDRQAELRRHLLRRKRRR
jgi:ubiquinone biosynthesis protein